MSEITLFDGGFDETHFEGKCRENGFVYWWGSELMTQLGYESEASFNKAINKAMTTCNTLNIQIFDNFVQCVNSDTGKTDFKLSRFACYLTVMNSDSKKTAVAKAQAYFATLAGAVQDHISEVNKIDRIVIRDEISERETSLSSVANQAKVTNYGFFQNAGYRGMYNMNLGKLKEMRGIDSKRSPLDFMGKEELAANLFRITQTELKIKQEGINGQSRLENAAQSVGKEVRQTMIKISGIAPEKLKIEQDIKEVKKDLKAKNKNIKAIGKKSI